jgi:phosphatidylinositol glycan class O
MDGATRYHKSRGSRCILLLRLLLPPTLIALGLTIFTQSFFLSRTSFDHRSSCASGAAGNLLKEALGLNDNEIRFLRENRWISDHRSHSDHHNVTEGNNGCWMPRKVDSMAIIVVDALRFDFARDHLPLSVGARLFPDNNGQNKTSSSLYQFVADPPTVTMQRLKGLTTGGLPTFADITGSFGGASIEEDSWIEQLKNAPWEHRMMHNHIKKPQIAFVGDDTWIDLFPTQFDDAHPYPSFNTRDLDTVDNGCLLHLPRLLDRLAGLKTNNHPTTDVPPFELMVSHFLGVDHVGHTYGPNNPHMEKKLQQMDKMLSSTLDRIDSAPEKSCIVAFVLGDHGMTEDGNHGGGTSEEVNAGLFVHFSPGCNARAGYDQRIDGRELGSESLQAFDSIHQIDLVPTISLLLGLPIPYANIGGLVTAILPNPFGENEEMEASSSTPYIATALALNAAQVWRYLHTYSQTSRDLPRERLLELKDLLDSATTLYREAILQSQKELQDNTYHDSTEFRQACGLFKIFLAESTGLGKQVWTQFNENGMMIGICTLFIAWILANPLWKRDVRKQIGMILCWFGTNNKIVVNSIKEDQFASSLQSFRQLEVAASLICMIFYSGVLTFGNSYIEHEGVIVTFFFAILCLLVFRRWHFESNKDATRTAVHAYLPLVVIMCSRFHDTFITGHGLDPSIRLHASHNALVFLPALAVLLALRLKWFESTQKTLSVSNSIDILTIVCLACSWWEKRSRDHSRNGYEFAQASITFVMIGVIHSLYCTSSELISQANENRVLGSWKLLCHSRLALFRVMLFIVIVTGPSTACTAVMVLVQCASLSQMMMQSKAFAKIDAPVMAAMWRLLVRQIFFATNHHCSFNRLHFTAAFVATETFQFHVAGFSLFMNTFGWELLGTLLLLLTSQYTNFTTANSKDKNEPSRVWEWFCFYQCTETLTSCISVSAMKRHREYLQVSSFVLHSTLHNLKLIFLSFLIISDGMGNICPEIHVCCNIYCHGVDVLVR